MRRSILLLVLLAFPATASAEATVDCDTLQSTLTTPPGDGIINLEAGELCHGTYSLPNGASSRPTATAR